MQFLQSVFGVFIFFGKNHKLDIQNPKCKMFWYDWGPIVHHTFAAYNFIIEPIIELAILRSFESTAFDPVVIFYLAAGIANLFIYFQRILPVLETERKQAKMRKAKEEVKQKEASITTQTKESDVVAKKDISINDSLLINPDEILKEDYKEEA